MKIKALNKIKHDGKTYCAGEVLNISKDDAVRIIESGAALEFHDEKKALDGKMLLETTEDFNTLKVDELRAVCAHLELSVKGNKDELVDRVENATTEEVDLNALDKEALVALAKEEGIELPENADEEEIRTILEESGE